MPRYYPIRYMDDAAAQTRIIDRLLALREKLAAEIEPDLAEIIDHLLSQYREQLELKLDTREAIARAMARSAAVKRGQRLSQTEMQEIINQLFACENPLCSPSGRACYISFNLDDLERQFAE